MACPASLFDGFIQAAKADTPAWMKGFLDLFYNMDVYGGSRVSDPAFQASLNVANAASATAAVACVPTWETDFRQDLPKIDVPVLVVHGDADRILPFPITAKRLPGLIKEIELVVIEGGPHAIAWTHADQVNDGPAAVHRRPRAGDRGLSPTHRCRRPARRKEKP